MTPRTVSPRMTSTTDFVYQTIPLGMQWPTLDPFLFCAHHRDAYPPGTTELAPAASLAGRRIGQDFDNVDGWNMYHGSKVAGFPAHPHRGFETVTYVRRGVIDHSDSLGARARFGQGDTQWLTAGRGIVHSEMFPLLDPDGPNPLELFQIWLNLPAADKMVEPYFSMLWADEIPIVTHRDEADAVTRVTVIAGRFADTEPCTPPPDSWAGAADAHVAIWHLVLEPGARFVLPAAAGAEVARVLYLFEGTDLSIAPADEAESQAHELPADTGAVVDADRAAQLVAGPSGAEIMVLQGRPIGEPVAQYGPFVMNTEDEIRQAMADYRATQFGGWPWATPDPDHGPGWRRFADRQDPPV